MYVSVATAKSLYSTYMYARVPVLFSTVTPSPFNKINNIFLTFIFLLYFDVSFFSVYVSLFLVYDIIICYISHYYLIIYIPDTIFSNYLGVISYKKKSYRYCMQLYRDIVDCMVLCSHYTL